MQPARPAVDRYDFLEILASLREKGDMEALTLRELMKLTGLGIWAMRDRVRSAVELGKMEAVRKRVKGMDGTDAWAAAYRIVKTEKSPRKGKRAS